MTYQSLYRHLSLTLLICFSLTWATAQGKGGGHSPNFPSKEKIQAEKKDFLTKELDLSDKEAESLMTILNELDEQRFKLWKDAKELRDRIRRGDKLSDTEYSQHFDRVMNNRVKEAELERTYYSKCKSVLPMSKLIHLERANREFAKQFFTRKKH